MQNSVKKISIILISVIIFFTFIASVYLFFQNEKNSPTYLSIQNVYISGAKFTDISSVKNIVGNLKNVYIENIDIDILQEYLIHLPFVKNTQIIKKYPNKIIIKLNEKNIEFTNEEDYPLDEDFSPINYKIQNENLKKSLIKIYGNPNAEKTKKIFKELDKIPFIKRRITGAMLISNRRWDIYTKIYGKDILFRLPEINTVKTLANFFRSTYKTNILTKNISVIDLRSDKVIIK
jgi:cell division septal protein FtsQ